MNTTRRRLNDDVLFNVLHHTGYHCDITVALMSSCRFFYHEVAKALLRKTIVTISKDEQARKFLVFLAAENNSRYPHLRSLDFQPFELSKKVAEEWLSIIPRFEGLETLRLPHGDNILIQHDGLATAFAQLTSLRHLHIGIAYELSLRMVRDLKSKLVSLSINWAVEDMIWDILPDHTHKEYHPVPFLANHSSSLQELKSSAWYPIDVRPTSDVVYPNMRRFSAELLDYPVIVPLINAYPNLSSIYLMTSYHAGYELTPTSWDSFRRHHNSNLAGQSQAPACVWPHLRSFTGDLIDLYLLAPTCRIPRVWVTGDVSSSDFHLEILRTTLALARPTQLKIRGATAGFLGNEQQGLIAVLRSPACSGLQALELDVMFWKDDREAALDELLVRRSVTIACSR